jgi:GT2 family glycosyltransferase
LSNKTVLAFVTFGGTEFTKLLVESVKKTTDKVDMFAIVGKVDDNATVEYLESEGIPFIKHSANFGFPVGINDIYDYAWKTNAYEYLILAGNDVVCYNYCINSLIKQAEITDYEVISAKQYDVRNLITDFPETKREFAGDDFVIRDFSERPWDRFTDYSEEEKVEDMQLFDIQNLCLYKKSVFDKIGYTDANYFPAYFVDNDYALRMARAGIKYCSLSNARFFHFWSRVLKQGTGGSTPHFFENNRAYYMWKWGGPLNHELKNPDLGIFDRDYEYKVVEFWKNH